MNECKPITANKISVNIFLFHRNHHPTTFLAASGWKEKHLRCSGSLSLLPWWIYIFFFYWTVIIIDLNWVHLTKYWNKFNLPNAELSITLCFFSCFYLTLFQNIYFFFTFLHLFQIYFDISVSCCFLNLQKKLFTFFYIVFF